MPSCLVSAQDGATGVAEDAKPGLPILRRDCFDTINVGYNVFHRKFVVYALCAGRLIR
jgi:hypothetical protein